MANRYKSFADFLTELKAILRIPSGDTSENVTLLSLFQTAAMDAFFEAKGTINDQNVSTGSISAAASFGVSIALIAIDQLEVTLSGFTYNLRPISQPQGPAPVDGLPTGYAVVTGSTSGASAAVITSTFHLFPSANYTLDYRLVYKGIVIPSSTTDNTLLPYESLYPSIMKRVLQQMQIKQGAQE